MTKDLYCILKKNRWTKAEIARRLGVTRQSVDSWLEDPSKIKLEHMVKMSKEVGFTMTINKGDVSFSE